MERTMTYCERVALRLIVQLFVLQWHGYGKGHCLLMEECEQL